MKTQIIQLEAHDDHISIRDKMNWSKTPRILLVLPRRRRFDLNLLDLKLIQRHAHSLGAELGLVTKSAKIIRTAKELGIPIFKSNLAAQREAWPQEKSRPSKRRKAKQNLREVGKELRPIEAKWRKHPLTRLGFFTLATLSLLLLAFAFIPQARIEIEPERRTQSLVIPMRANLGIEDVFLSGSIPAYKLRATLTEERSLVSSGRIAIPVQVARGSVLFRNLTDLPIQIPAGTVIRSIEDEEIRFATVENAKIAGDVNAEVKIPVKSLIFGERGNLEANTLQAIEGELGLWLAVTNPEATSGGGDSYVSAPTERDREELRTSAMTHFHKDADAEIKKELAPGDLIFPNSLGEIKILEEIYDPPEGETGDRLTLQMSAAFEVLYAKEADLVELAQSALLASIPPGFTPVPNSLNFSPASEFETNLVGVTSWQMRVAQELRPIISSTQVGSLVQGHSSKTAIRILGGHFSLISSPKITITPAWWQWLPIAPFRIEVIVK